MLYLGWFGVNAAYKPLSPSSPPVSSFTTHLFNWALGEVMRPLLYYVVLPTDILRSKSNGFSFLAAHLFGRLIDFWRLIRSLQLSSSARPSPIHPSGSARTVLLLYQIIRAVCISIMGDST